MSATLTRMTGSRRASRATCRAPRPPSPEQTQRHRRAAGARGRVRLGAGAGPHARHRRVQTSSGIDVTAQSADLNARMTSLKSSRENYLDPAGQGQDHRRDVVGAAARRRQPGPDRPAAGSDQRPGRPGVLRHADGDGHAEGAADAAAKPTHHKSGIEHAWDRAVNGFVTGVEALIARSGRAALVLLLLVVGDRAATGLAGGPAPPRLSLATGPWGSPDIITAR